MQSLTRLFIAFVLSGTLSMGIISSAHAVYTFTDLGALDGLYSSAQ